MINWTVEKENNFLKRLALGDTVTHAAKCARVSRTAVYQHKWKDEAFSQAWEDAYSAGTDEFEEIAAKRAKEKSDILMIFLLKARDPERFKDKWQGDLNTDIKVETVSYEEEQEEKD